MVYHTIHFLNILVHFYSISNVLKQTTFWCGRFQDSSCNSWNDIDDGAFSNARDQYLSDHDAHQSAQIQFYGAAISSLAVWVYNIYDVRKNRYNYTDNESVRIFALR